MNIAAEIKERVDKIQAPTPHDQQYSLSRREMRILQQAEALDDYAAARSEESFWHYRQYMNPNMKVDWFPRLLARELQRFYTEWIAGRQPVLLLVSPPQHGKLLADDTPMLTTEGWKTHGDLKPGDVLCHPNGGWTMVIGVQPPSTANYIVTLSNGEQFWCNGQHEWTLHDLEHRRTKTVNTAYLSGRVYTFASMIEAGNNESDYGLRWQLPYVSTLIGRPDDFQSLPDTSAYECGCQIGRGFPAEIEHYYLTSPPRQRLELLAGLLDSVGTVDEAGAIELRGLNGKTISSIVTLLATFGWRAKLNGIDDNDGQFNLYFHTTLLIPTRKPEWLLNQRPIASLCPVMIQSIEKTNEPKTGRCITVSAIDGLYLAGRTLQPTHNSHNIIDFTSWAVGKRPETNVIFSSFSDRLGVRANLRMQRLMTGDRFARTFNSGKPRLAQKAAPGQYLRNQSILEFNSGGSFRNTTVLGSVTGEGLDLGVIDDPLKGRAAANSKATRDKTWDWLTDDFFTRFSETAGLIMTLTRWHIDDPAGRLIEHFGSSNVREVRFPAIATRDEKFRKEGEPLFPALKSKQFLLKRKKVMLPANWEALYQGSPVIAGGDMFSIENFKYTRVVDKSQVVASVRYWDKAGTDDGGKFTAGVRMHKMKDGTFVVDSVVRGQWSALKRETNIKNTALVDNDEFPSITTWVEQEPGSGGKESAESTIRNLAGMRIYADRVSGDKMTRAEPYSAQVEGGNVILKIAPWNIEFVDEHERFPNGKFKDQVDSAAGGFNKIAHGANYASDLDWVG